MSKLLAAVRAGDLGRVQRRLMRGASYEQAEEALSTAIDLNHAAIAIELAHELVSYEEDAEDSTFPENSFFEAVERGKTETALALLEEFDLDIISETSVENCETCALLLAVVGSDLQFPPSFYFPATAVTLLDAGADPNSTDHTKMTVMHAATCLVEGWGTKEDRLALISKAISKGGALDTWMWTPNTVDMQPLHCAIYTHFYEAAELLIEAGAPVNLEYQQPPQTHRLPPLFVAAHSGVEMFRLILDSGADVNAVEETGDTFLHTFLTHTEDGPPYHGLATVAPLEGQAVLRLALERGAVM